MRTTSKHLFTVRMGGEVVATYRQAATVAKFVARSGIKDDQQIEVDITRDGRFKYVLFTDLVREADIKIIDKIIRQAVAQLDAACHVA